jgi:hypothetical protein
MAWSCRNTKLFEGFGLFTLAFLQARAIMKVMNLPRLCTSVYPQTGGSLFYGGLLAFKQCVFLLVSAIVKVMNLPRLCTSVYPQIGGSLFYGAILSSDKMGAGE